MKHTRPLILTIIFILAAVSFTVAQTPKSEAPQRRVAISLREADPISGTLVGADANSLLVEVDGKLTKIALDDVTMIIFAPGRAKVSTTTPSTVETPINDNAAETGTPPAPTGTTPPLEVTPSTTSPTSTGGTVQVRGYYRKDGTYVRPHTRRAPRRRN